ncbi:DUF6318 family protein [Microbacterium sp. A93]|uniref:DUF6318 family protein n=1 Tax=Microbacterium sp. A93 TaxID=3450716 RepID=UPI003F43B42D
MPAAVTEKSERGARAALDHWWTTHRYLELTGDASPLEEMSGSGCGSCVHTSEFWQDVYTEGNWSSGSGREPTEVEVSLSGQKSDARFAFAVDQEEYHVWTPAGLVLNDMHRHFADTKQWGARARYTEDGHWIVYDIWMYYDGREDADGEEDGET